jgi:uncharacterized protein YbbK (DUF523 family)
MILVSACLLGLNTKYDGGHSLNEKVCSLSNLVPLVPVCPEQLGGLATPRPRAEIQGGDGYDVLSGRAHVLTDTGTDSTEAFLRGARETVKLASAVSAEAALLKARSPSCGNCRIFDGSFSGATHDGAGVTAALLLQNGIPVFSEEQLESLEKFLEDSLYIKNRGGGE